MVSDGVMSPFIKLSEFSPEDTRNELLSSATVEVIVKEINEAWRRYVF